MIEFSNQGELSSTSSGTLLATGTISTLFLDKLSIIRLHNPLAYVVSLYKYESLTNTTVLLYNLNLSAGDTLTDNLGYSLNAGDQIIGYSDIPGTSYYTYGITY
jgi:hypothetical protein